MKPEQLTVDASVYSWDKEKKIFRIQTPFAEYEYEYDSNYNNPEIVEQNKVIYNQLKDAFNNYQKNCLDYSMTFAPQYRDGFVDGIDTIISLDQKKRTR